MAVNFNDDTWKFVIHVCEDMLLKQTSLIIQPETTFEEVLIARGKILALKTILTQPQQIETVAANKRT